MTLPLLVALATPGKVAVAQGDVPLGPGVIKAAPVGGPFELVDDTGREVTEESWPGKLLLLFFGFTHCPDVCPIALDRFAQVLELLGPDAERVQALLVSVDPERDTPEVIGPYVDQFDPRIMGLTGTLEQIREAARSYRVFYFKGIGPRDNPSAYTVDHSIFEYLMAPDGTNLYIFRSVTPPEHMVELIRAALRG